MYLSRMPTGEPEIFTSIQGEGISSGVPSVFVRLGYCNLKCSWCFVPETPVLMADWTWKPIAEIEPGERVVAVQRARDRARPGLVRTRVHRVLVREAPTVRVDDRVRCTPDHPFWIEDRGAEGRLRRSGWRRVDRALGGSALYTTDPIVHREREYRRGWLAGVADGDGSVDHPALAVAGKARGFEEGLTRDLDSRSWRSGYLGGTLDADGSFSGGILRIDRSRSSARTLARVRRTLGALDVPHTMEEREIRIRPRAGSIWRALSLSRPTRPSFLESALGRPPGSLRVVRSVEPSGLREPVVDLSTGAGSFVAAGFVVKNCDTPYTWDWTEYDPKVETTTMDPTAVVERVVAEAGGTVRNVVFTGGEPMIQQPHLEPVARRLADYGFHLEVETNGTVVPTGGMAEAIDQWNVSPKLASSDNRASAREVPDALEWFAKCPNAWWKFVITVPEDVDEVVELVRRYDVPRERVILMPEGTEPETALERSRWLAGICQETGFRLGERLHIYMWGAQRGR